MPRVIYFEISAENPECTAKFYRKVVDWKIEKWQGSFNRHVTTGKDKEPGINVAIIEKGNFKITFNTVRVSSVDEFLKGIVVAGRRVVLPEGAVSSQRYLAYCAGTEGNVFGVIQRDPSAK